MMTREQKLYLQRAINHFDKAMEWLAEVEGQEGLVEALTLTIADLQEKIENASTTGTKEQP